MFITFEGSEGSGKTSQIAPLAERLRQAGHDVLTTREPGGNPICDQIRAVLLDRANTGMHPRTEMLLFLAARAQLVEQVIRPHLEKGRVVLSDRYGDSTLAYQGYGRGGDLEQLRSMLDFATNHLKPDLTLLFDLDVEQGLARRNKCGEVNRLDVLSLEFYQRVRRGYLELARLEPERWAIIDASGSPENVQESVWRVVEARVNKKVSPQA